MGGGSEGAARLDFFGVKSPVWFARARLAGAASNNKPTRSRLAEGSRLHVLPSRSRPSTRLDAWEGDLSAEAEIISSISSCVCVLHDVARGGGQNKKIARRSGTPQGRRHAPTSPKLWIPSRKGEKKCAKVGGGCIDVMRGGGLKNDLLSRE